MLISGKLLPVYMAIYVFAKDGAKMPDIPGYVTINTSRWRVFVPESLRHLSDKRLAIIDDCTITGDTLAALHEVLKTFGFRRDRIVSGVLVCAQTVVEADKAPDEYGYCVEHASYHFPWGERF